VAFTPPSSIAGGGGGGVVSVSNFPADQLVHFTQPVSVDASGFAVPVTGPLTNAQLRAAPVSVDVDNFPASQPVTVESLPLPDGAATEATLGAAAESLDDVGLTAILQRERMETE
jgi:hypothetical protein